MTKQQRTPLQNILDNASRYAQAPNFKNLHFTERGLWRYQVICGWIAGLYQAGQAQLATKAANDLWAALKRLNDYGHTTNYEGAEMRDWRVSVSDDGTMNGFNLAFFRLVNPEVFESKRSEIYEGLKGDSEYCSKMTVKLFVYVDEVEPSTAKDLVARAREEKNRTLFENAYMRALKDLKVTKELTVRVTRPEGYEGVPYWNRTEEAHYSFSHNAGLIYRGPGQGETFSVNIGTGSEFWSLHT